MIGNSNIVPSTSSSDVSITKTKPLMPWAVHSLITNLEKFSSAVDQAVKEYQDLVRQEAAADWGEVANSIIVEFNKDTMSVNIFSEHPDATFLEYGTPEAPPTPVLRMAAIRAQEKLVPFIKKELSKVGLSKGGSHA